MPESNAQQDVTRFSDFLRDLSIELKSKDIEEMRFKLLAFDRVDEVLTTLRKDFGTQIFRGIDVVEEYRKSHQELDEQFSYYTLDYIIRKDNVELQLEVRLLPSKGYYLEPESFEQFNKVLEVNQKTEEIIVTWATKELASIALNFGEIRNYIMQGLEAEIAQERLCPMRETIIAAFERHRRIFLKPTDIQEMRRIKFNLSDTFSKILFSKLDNLVESAEKRRARDRTLAIQSITESDIEQIQKVFSRSQLKELELNELKEQIEAISENVELE